MACASGAASIALGADLIRAGVTPTALVGGVDALTHICFMGFNALKLLDPDAVPPLRPRAARHVHRGGRRLPRHRGRGALPGAGRARARAARRLRHDHRRASRHRPASRGRGDDPRDAAGSGRRRARRPRGRLRERARHRDPAERPRGGAGAPAGLRRGRRARQLPPSRWWATRWRRRAAWRPPPRSSRSSTGSLPPTANLEQMDPDVPFDCLPGVARPAEVSAALSNSFGFGGQNVSSLHASRSPGGRD